MSDDGVTLDISTAGRMAAALEKIAEHVSHPLVEAPRGTPMETHFDVFAARQIRLQAQLSTHQWIREETATRSIYNLYGPDGVVASVVVSK